MLARFGRSDDLAAYGVAWMCVALPDAVTDTATLVALAVRAVTEDVRNAPKGPALATLGAARYRAGRLEAAVERLTEASASTGGRGEVTGWLFLAMAHARLGHAAEARQWLEKAAAWIEEALQRNPEEKPLDWRLRQYLQHLRREAEALVPPAGPR